jgi:L-fucose isomerase-like protein
MTLRIGLLPLARPTFDVPYAEEMAARAFAALEAAGFALSGDRALLFDAAATRAALARLQDEPLDLVLILQVTFADATMAVEIARAVSAPLAIWALPEPRAGGRLRLNAFCGMNLALHALGRAGLPAGWLYAAPEDAAAPRRLASLAAGREAVRTAPAALRREPSDEDRARAAEALGRLRGVRVGLVGEHPAGFDTCRYDPAELNRLLGVEVQRIALPDLFVRAEAADEGEVATLRARLDGSVSGLADLDEPQLERSLRVYDALAGMAREQGLQGLALRCWPEMFTDYGCAACGPSGLLSGEGVPCACEADVYGALTALMLQGVAGEPSWLVDIVDIDAQDDTAVLWHCGSAPLQMADPQVRPRAQIHSNRRMPLLAEFTLKPGRVTVARISQARNEPKLVLAGAQVLRAPMSFTGTSGVVRFDAAAGDVMSAMMDEALEHHVALVYGERRPALRAMAAELGLPVLELTP